jgi:large subunit ribosomal protein L22
MRGPKLNEGATAVGERHGTKATAKYVRSSAYKARVVLDLVRGLDVKRADEVLQFTDRSIAHDIRKVLASAVANATDANSGAYIADADELFVLACFADEGPTLRRFRPRARGRATRRARVERPRMRAAAAKGEIDAIDSDEAIEDAADDAADEVVDAAETTAAIADVVETDDVVAEADEAESDSEFVAADWAGSLKPDADGNGPESHPIKGNADSMLYHTPDSRYYKVTKAEVWFDTEENAEAAGFAKPGTTKDED